MIVNHTGNVMSVFQMLLDRLPFLTNDFVDPIVTVQGVNALTASRLTLEIMNELQCCFAIDPETSVGDESVYNVNQLSLIADLLALHFLLRLSLSNTDGDGATAGGTNNDTFLKRAKAGSAEVEYGQLDVSSSTKSKLALDTLFDKFMLSAIRKGKKLGCIFTICDDCSLDFSVGFDVLPFSTDFTSCC